MRPSELFPDAKGGATKKLLELASRFDELRAETRGVREQSAATSAEQDATSRELREAEAREHAFGDAGPRIKATRAKLAKLERVATERADTLRIVSDAAEQVDAQLRRHAREHSADLWAELTKDNSVAAARLTTTVEATAQALDDYRQAGARAAELMKLTDPELMRTARVPELPGEVVQFVKAAKVATASIRVPVPELPGQGPVVHLVEHQVETAA